jgi:hypothetical protein
MLFTFVNVRGGMGIGITNKPTHFEQLKSPIVFPVHIMTREVLNV